MSHIGIQMELDETICKRPVCPHPQCWVTLRRIEQGNPRYRTPPSISRHPVQHEDKAGGLPVLSVTTLPSNRVLSVTTLPSNRVLSVTTLPSNRVLSVTTLPSNRVLSVTTLPSNRVLSVTTLPSNRVLSVTTLPSSRVLHKRRDSQHSLLIDRTRETSPTTVYNMYNSAATCSMEQVFFPGGSSYREITAPSMSSGSFFSPRKVEILHPSFQDTSRDLTMVWVPNTQQKPPKTEDRGKTLKVWIKDLSLTDPLGGKKREKQNPGLTINKKKKKPPTGGFPLNQTLVRSPSSHTKNGMAAGKLQEQPNEASKCGRRQHEQWPEVDPPPSPSPGGIIVENRRVVLHDTREKCLVVPHVGPVYRLDEQSAALNDMEIDLEGIRNQYYLWKKYINLAGPRRRIKPPDHRTSKSQRSAKSMAPDQLSHIGLFPYDPDSALSYYKSQALETPSGSVICDTTRSRDSESRNSPSLTGFSQNSWTDEELSKTPAEMDVSKRVQQQIPGERRKEAQPAKLSEARDVAPELPELDQKDVPGEEESTKQNSSPGPPESTGESTDVRENLEMRTSSPQPTPPPPSPMH
ncbi:uncharacterized protein C9orf43 homolog isoform X2 [Rhinoderma darwinii]|uniref:uncharacterized protein C9orf43 homolog isoform X2 n=1 Tax=Rhinoderma darwinii TaxID=43563 RepID=UPI003F674061